MYKRHVQNKHTYVMYIAFVYFLRYFFGFTLYVQNKQSCPKNLSKKCTHKWTDKIAKVRVWVRVRCLVGIRELSRAKPSRAKPSRAEPS